MACSFLVDDQTGGRTPSRSAAVQDEHGTGSSGASGAVLPQFWPQQQPDLVGRSRAVSAPRGSALVCGCASDLPPQQPVEFSADLSLVRGLERLSILTSFCLRSSCRRYRAKSITGIAGLRPSWNRIKQVRRPRTAGKKYSRKMTCPHDSQNGCGSPLKRIS